MQASELGRGCKELAAQMLDRKTAAPAESKRRFVEYFNISPAKFSLERRKRLTFGPGISRHGKADRDDDRANKRGGHPATYPGARISADNCGNSHNNRVLPLHRPSVSQYDAL